MQSVTRLPHTLFWLLAFAIITVPARIPASRIELCKNCPLQRHLRESLENAIDEHLFSIRFVRNAAWPDAVAMRNM